jgi:hypothetical protein
LRDQIGRESPQLTSVARKRSMRRCSSLAPTPSRRTRPSLRTSTASLAPSGGEGQDRRGRVQPRPCTTWAWQPLDLRRHQGGAAFVPPDLGGRVQGQRPTREHAEPGRRRHADAPAWSSRCRCRKSRRTTTTARLPLAAKRPWIAGEDDMAT